MLELSSQISLNTPESHAAALDRIWPEIEEANQTIPIYAKISKDHVLLLSDTQAIPRTAKGTAQKQAAIKLYQRELDALDC